MVAVGCDGLVIGVQRTDTGGTDMSVPYGDHAIADTVADGGDGAIAADTVTAAGDATIVANGKKVSSSFPRTRESRANMSVGEADGTLPLPTTATVTA